MHVCFQNLQIHKCPFINQLFKANKIKIEHQQSRKRLTCSSAEGKSSSAFTNPFMTETKSGSKKFFFSFPPKGSTRELPRPSCLAAFKSCKKFIETQQRSSLTWKSYLHIQELLQNDMNAFCRKFTNKQTLLAINDTDNNDKAKSTAIK